MSRIRRLLPAALLLGGCVAPGLKYIEGLPMTTTTTTSGDPGTGDDGSTSIMTTTESSSGEGTASSEGASDGSQSGTTTTGFDSSSASSDTATTGASEPVCGDGVVEGDEECDDANDIADDRCHDCTKNRWIFASAAFHNNGDIGGLEGADSRCRQYALQSGRADDTWKTFIAWLSDADHDVRDRLYPGRGRYVRTDGVVVAETVEQFFSGALAAPINVDEHGNQDIGGGVLTGTRPDGTAAPGTHCDNWTTSSLSDHSAYKGNASSITETWTMFPDDPPLPCTALSARLYCIEGE